MEHEQYESTRKHLLAELKQLGVERPAEIYRKINWRTSAGYPLFEMNDQIARMRENIHDIQRHRDEQDFWQAQLDAQKGYERSESELAHG